MAIPPPAAAAISPIGTFFDESFELSLEGLESVASGTVTLDNRWRGQYSSRPRCSAYSHKSLEANVLNIGRSSVGHPEDDSMVVGG
jgi:hypothetical protein